jgi:hypothetical protein
MSTPIKCLAAYHKLPLGLYRVHWKNDGGVSLAAIGMNRDGSRWIAPVNWIEPATLTAEIQDDIEMVEVVEKA